MDNKDSLYLYSKTKKLLVNTNDYIEQHLVNFIRLGYYV